MCEWIRADRIKPDVGSRVLCYCRGGSQMVLLWDGSSWREYLIGHGNVFYADFVPHWARLPEPPEEE